MAPVVLLELELDGAVIRLFGVASRVESPSDVTLDSLHLATFVPADEPTRARLTAERP